MPSSRYTVRLPPTLDAQVQARVRAGTPFAVLIREALSAYLADTPPTYPPTAADRADRLHTLEEQLALVRTRVEALEQLLTPRRQAADSPADRGADTVPTPADTGPTDRRRGERPGTLRAQILTLLHDHPAGLTAVEIKVYLGIDRRIGDVLQGMVRQERVTRQGRGSTMRYFARESRGP